MHIVKMKARDSKLLAELNNSLEARFSCSKPFLPDYAFYNSPYKRLGKLGKDGVLLTLTTKSTLPLAFGNANINNMAIEIFSWLGISRGNAIIEFSSGSGHPGLFTYQSNMEKIQIDSVHVTDTYAVGAILAHEIMHLFLRRVGIARQDVEENELLTDLASIHAGLGVLMLNGMKQSSDWMITIAALLTGRLYMKEEKRYFGYFDGEDYGNHFVKWLKAKHCAVGQIKGYLHPNARYFVPGVRWVQTKGETDISIGKLEKKKLLETIKKWGIAIAITSLGVLWWLSQY